MLGQSNGKQRRPNLLQQMPSRILHKEMDNDLRNSQIPISIFLQLATNFVEDVNREVDCNNMSYA